MSNWPRFACQACDDRGRRHDSVLDMSQAALVEVFRARRVFLAALDTLEGFGDFGVSVELSPTCDVPFLRKHADCAGLYVCDEYGEPLAGPEGVPP